MGSRFFKPDTEEYKRYSNDQLIEQSFYRSGRLEGCRKFWRETGTPWTRSFYLNGILEGQCKSWYENGKIKALEFYRNGEINGERKIWHVNGGLWLRHFWKDNQIIDYNFTWKKKKIFLKLKERLYFRVKFSTIDFIIPDPERLCYWIIHKYLRSIPNLKACKLSQIILIMSFAVRTTWKSRAMINTADDGNIITMPNPEETKAIVEAIQKFKQKSAHSQIQNIAELQTVLSKSSVNPEFNPSAKQGVDSILRGKHDTNADTSLDQLTNTPITAAGFSSQSVSRNNVRSQVARLEKELAKELEEIQKKFRPKTETTVSETKENDEKEDPQVDPEVEALIEQNEEDELQFENQERMELGHVVAPGFGPQTVRPGMSLSSAAQRVQPSQSTQGGQNQTKSQENNSEQMTARKLISIGYPARAAMARGYQPRVSGLGGNAIRRTALGLSDAF